MSKKQRKEAHGKPASRARRRLLAIARETLGDLCLDVLGHDSCVLATRVLHDRLAADGIKSTPLDCIAVATFDSEHGAIRVILADDDGHPAHAVLVADGTLIDLTLRQVREMDGRFPEMPIIFAILPQIREPCFATEMDTSGGVSVEYFFDTNRTPYFFMAYDWIRPNAEATVQRIKRLVDEGHAEELRRLVRR